MGKSLENIKKIASGKVSAWKDEAVERKKNIEWAKRSFKIAVRILREIRVQKPLNGMTQKKLADEMGVSPQYINKIVKGKENLTLETISKIESVLGITLLEVPSYDASNVISIQPAEKILVLDRAESIPVSEDVINYNKTTYIESTGTNG